ncbi:MAG: hypothetical protein K2L93_04860 [Muribaculaceae bacterium]|nr:hypothetical protein [Muribaculaceae bacterium]
MVGATRRISPIKALLSVAMMLLIVMTTIVQHHHHCSCHHHTSPAHEHHCALHIDPADQLRHDFDFNDSPTLHIDAAISTTQIDITPEVIESHLAYYDYPLTKHFTKWCADAARRGPPSAADHIG